MRIMEKKLEATIRGYRIAQESHCSTYPWGFEIWALKVN